MTLAPARKPRVRPETPHAILAVDPGETTGWCYFGSFRAGIVLGTLDLTRETPDAVIAKALDMVSCGAVLVLVVEDWALAGMSRASGGSLVGAYKQWEYAWLRAGQPRKRIVRAKVNEWRRAIFGRLLSTEEAKAMALARAKSDDCEVRDHNAAEAYCIARWAEHADAVKRAAAYRPRKVA